MILYLWINVEVDFFQTPETYQTRDFKILVYAKCESKTLTDWKCRIQNQFYLYLIITKFC